MAVQLPPHWIQQPDGTWVMPAKFILPTDKVPACFSARMAVLHLLNIDFGGEEMEADDFLEISLRVDDLVAWIFRSGPVRSYDKPPVFPGYLPDRDKLLSYFLIAEDNTPRKTYDEIVRRIDALVALRDAAYGITPTTPMPQPASPASVDELSDPRLPRLLTNIANPLQGLRQEVQDIRADIRKWLRWAGRTVLHRFRRAEEAQTTTLAEVFNTQDLVNDQDASHKVTHDLLRRLLDFHGIQVAGEKERDAAEWRPSGDPGPYRYTGSAMEHNCPND